MTSYQYGSNNPSSKIDLDGLEGIGIDIFFEEEGVIPNTPGDGYSSENISRAGGDASTPSDESSNRSANFDKGNQTEAKQLAENDLAKNNQKITEIDPKTGQKGQTIPDALKNNGKSTVEIKDVKEQSLSKQLRLQEQFSKSNGFKPELIINSSC